MGKIIGIDLGTTNSIHRDAGITVVVVSHDADVVVEDAEQVLYLRDALLYISS